MEKAFELEGGEATLGLDVSLMIEYIRNQDKNDEFKHQLSLVCNTFWALT
jgi:hypothetical protein